MKTLLVAMTVFLFLIVGLLAILAQFSRSGVVPEWGGGRLPPCPKRPNCVCSEYPEDPAHAVEAMTVDAGDSDLVGLVSGILSRMGGEVKIEQERYVAATFSSTLFGFVDDFQVRLEPAGKRLQIRSASRVGYSDGGVNRARVEQFRTKLRAALARKVSGSYQ